MHSCGFDSKPVFAGLGTPTRMLDLESGAGLLFQASMFIQAMDLGIIVPVCVLAGILLLRRSAWGYLLASVGMMKFLTLGIDVSLMGLNMARVGVPVSVVELGVFPSMALINVVMTIVLLRNVVMK
jgi:hypothetical protein